MAMGYGVVDVALMLGHTPLMMLLERTDYGISYVSGQDADDRVRLAAATAMREKQASRLAPPRRLLRTDTCSSRPRRTPLSHWHADAGVSPTGCLAFSDSER